MVTIAQQLLGNPRIILALIDYKKLIINSIIVFISPAYF